MLAQCKLLHIISTAARYVCSRLNLLLLPAGIVQVLSTVALYLVLLLYIL